MSRANKFNSLYKMAAFSYLIDPIFYASAIITILFCSFKFFFEGKFFVMGLGSSDLRPLFNSIPYISILTIPLLVLRLRPIILNDSLPVSPFKRFSALSLAAFSAFCVPVLLMTLIPICVSQFGDVEFLQCASAFLGILFYGFCAVSLTALCFEIFYSYTALPLIFSALFLAALNFIHLLPLYFRAGAVITFICQKFSFAWHFDSFSKGILDSRNLAYYIFVSFSLILLSSYFEYRRLGKKSSHLTVFLLTMILVFLSLSSQNLYFRIDLTKNKQFSLSPASKAILSNLDGTLRLTYYRSEELKNLYPQTNDVQEFLSVFASSNKNITLSLEKADEEKLKALGLQAQQLRHENGTKTEFVSVFSAIQIQYLEESSVIPFVLSTQSLEYDLTQRVQKLISGKKRKAYILSGNGRSLEESYSYVAPWLSSRGFETEELNGFNTTEVLKNLSHEDSLLIFGTKDLTYENAYLIEQAIDNGTKAFIATSPYHTNIEDEWKITKSDSDLLLSYLRNKGFAFDQSLVEDISCFSLTMATGEGNSAEYTTINYPLWITIQNQPEAKKGVTVFWASPLSLYNDAQPLLYTTNLAWTQKPAQNISEDLFLTNPFLIPKTASQSDSETGQFVVAARNKNISLVADQFFLSSLMTGFTSSEKSLDFRNYDYLTKELLVLNGENALASLMEKTPPSTSLYKIIDEEEFKSERKHTIILIFVLLPLIIASIFIGLKIKRR